MHYKGPAFSLEIFLYLILDIFILVWKGIHKSMELGYWKSQYEHDQVTPYVLKALHKHELIFAVLW